MPSTSFKNTPHDCQYFQYHVSGYTNLESSCAGLVTRHSVTFSSYAADSQCDSNWSWRIQKKRGRTAERWMQGWFKADLISRKWFWSKSHVQMVCGLIQEEDMRIYKGDQQHHNLCIHLLSNVNGKTICPPLLWPNKFLTCVLPLALHPCSHSILGSVLNGKENTLQPCICIYD